MTDYEVMPPPDRLADRVQLRTAFTTDRGEVVQFMVQLEYWREVVRYDHDCDAEGGHDITEEGLQMDVFRDGEKHRVDQISEPIPANEGFNAAEDDLRENAEDYIKRFEQWHGVTDESDQ